jgi:hypothetical protein
MGGMRARQPKPKPETVSETALSDKEKATDAGLTATSIAGNKPLSSVSAAELAALSAKETALSDHEQLLAALTETPRGACGRGQRQQRTRRSTSDAGNLRQCRKHSFQSDLDDD